MKREKEALEKAASQVHTQIGQSKKGSSSERTSAASTPPTRSPRDSVERSGAPSFVAGSTVDQLSDKLSSARTTSESIAQESVAASHKVSFFFLTFSAARLENF